MVPSVYGVLLVLAGLSLFRKPPSDMLNFLLVATLFGGTAAIFLPAFGNSSVPPAQLVLGILAARLVFSPAGRFPKIAKGIASNAYLALFCIYGFIAAMLMPRLFSGSIDVVPQIGHSIYRGDMFAVQPLQFSSQNITQGVYLLGTLVAAISAYLIARDEHRSAFFAKTIIVMAWVHSGFGLLDLGLTAVHSTVLDYIRNAGYAQVDQSAGDFHRIAGVFPEASAYAAYGFMLFVFTVELWLRNVMRGASGWAGLVLGCVLFASTSSSAYVGLAGYAILLTTRLTLYPSAASLKKGSVIALTALGACVALLTFALLSPSVATAVRDVVSDMSVGKLQSLSGQQRTFWARNALAAFSHSYGVGIGPGSFRSSSLITGVLGATGLIGACTLFAYFLKILPPLKRSTYALALPSEQAIGRSAAWAAIAGLLPAFVSAPTADPGIMFALFAGVALAWRMPYRVKASSSEGKPEPKSFEAIAVRPMSAEFQ
jgi:hypothetical protein